MATVKKTVKKTASKSAGKKTAPKSTVPVGRLSISGGADGNDKSINVKPIENGFLISESGTKGKGKKQTWYERQYFSPTNPVPNINIPKGRVSFGGNKK